MDGDRPSDRMTWEEAMEQVRTAFDMWESEWVVGPKEHKAFADERDAVLRTLEEGRAK